MDALSDYDASLVAYVADGHEPGPNDTPHTELGRHLLSLLDKRSNPAGKWAVIENAVSSSRQQVFMECLLGYKNTGKLAPRTDGPRPAPMNGQAKKSEILPTLRCMADVQSEEVDWLWYPRIPLGRLTALEGDPGEGKSFLALAIAAALSVGSGLPGLEEKEPCNTIFLTAEDSLADTVRPRLDEMKANVERIFGIDAPFPLDATGQAHLETLIQSNTARLVVIDPITAFLPPGVDIHRANEVRNVLSRLAQIAERHRCAILIIRHLAKGSTGKAIYRGLGSIDFTAACRSVLLAGRGPDDPNSRALVQIKTNLGPTADPIGYSIEHGQFRWTGATELTAYQILAPDGNPTQLEKAKDWLREFLATDQPAKEIEKAACEARFSVATLRRAKEALGVRSAKEGKTGPWIWTLSKEAQGVQDDQDVQK